MSNFRDSGLATAVMNGAVGKDFLAVRCYSEPRGWVFGGKAGQQRRKKNNKQKFAGSPQGEQRKEGVSLLYLAVKKGSLFAVKQNRRRGRK